MGRAKVELKRITEIKKSKVTFQKRKDNIIKKAIELTTLCDVNICMIISSDHQENLETFPADRQEFDRLINLQKRNRDQAFGKTKTYNLSGFFEDRKNKIEDALARARKGNLEAKFPTWFDSLNGFSDSSLLEFASALGGKIDLVKHRIQSLKETSSNVQNLDCCPSNPTTTFDQNPNSMMMMPFENEDEWFMQPSNLDSMMDMIYGDDNNFGLQSSMPEFCFPPEMLRQQPCI